MLAVASATDSDATFVAASQIIRLVLMLISAPVIVWAMGRWVRRRARTAAPGDESTTRGAAVDGHSGPAPLLRPPPAGR